MRIVSLVPSLTETLSAWGITPIGCTRFCERPDIQSVGGTKNPNIDQICELDPDMVILDTEENRLADFEALAARGVPTHALSVTSVTDAFEQLESLAARLNVDWRAPTLPEPIPARASALVPIWKRPFMALSSPTYGASLLELLGISPLPSGAGPYPVLAIPDARRLGADLVLAPNEPYPFSERHRPFLSQFGKVVFLEGKDLLWWGVRTEGALSRLQEVIKPFAP